MFRTPFIRGAAFFFVFLIGWIGVPCDLRIFADGYYDEYGNWIENYTTTDSDGDGLSDYDESYLYGTDSLLTDTDGDGFSDYEEVHNFYTNPTVFDASPTDSDGDGLPDSDEIDFYGTNPFGSDTDGDGTSDYDEITIYFTNPTVSDATGSNPAQDSDGDGLSDSEESNYGTNPFYGDTDGDGYSDYDEIHIHLTSPTDSSSYSGSSAYQSYGYGDSDGDGLSDYEEAYYHYTNPSLADTDEDGLTDYEEIFGVIVTTYVEYSSTYPMDDGYGNTTYYDYTYTESYSTNGYPNPLNADTDSDLLPDGYEYYQGLNPVNANDGIQDHDGDGLTRGQEYVLGTNHLTADTDGDGHTDRNEFLAGTNPLDPASPPPSEPAPGSGGSGSGGSGSGTGGSGSGDSGSGSQGSGESGTGGNGTNPDPDPGLNPPGATPPPSGGSSQDYGSLNLGDVDADGLPDAWEFRYFGGKQRYSGSSDPDGDALNNLAEYLFRSHPARADSDGDGLRDDVEQSVGSNPLSGDSDGDRYDDLWEHEHGLDPADASDMGEDQNNDGIPDRYAAFRTGLGLTATSDYDEDEDGLELGFDGSVASYDSWVYGPDGTPYNLVNGEFHHRTYPDRSDSDGDGVSDLVELLPYTMWDADPYSGNSFPVQVEATDPRNPDSDGDGFTDGEERNGDSNPNDPWSWPAIDFFEDSDDDGLTDLEEVDYGTDPLLVDTDGDGFSDFEEIYYYGTDPTDPANFWIDSDGDGLSDAFEMNVVGTDPLLTDSDGDGFSDALEIFQHQTDPLDTSHYWADADGDGLRDDTEIQRGTSTTSSDSDGDGLSDGWEYYVGTDPTVADAADTDGDGILDVWEQAYGLDPESSLDAVGDEDGDTLTNLEEFLHKTEPWFRDSDSDWLDDDLEVLVYGTNPLLWDTDDDGFADGLELFWYFTDPLDALDSPNDSDGDGIPDDWELAHGMDSLDPDDAYLDADGDGLDNGAEYWLGGNPQLADSDGDGVGDFAQWESGDELSSEASYIIRLSDGAITAHDSDGDGLSDAWESAHGFDLRDAGDALLDEDSDGLTNLEEFTLGTNLLLSDTDGDGLSDGDEVDLHGTDPKRVDSDSDGLRDGDEISLAMNPVDSTDGRADVDGDGLSFAQELLIGTDPNLADTDGDLANDKWEDRNSWRSGSPSVTVPFDPLTATDGEMDHDDDTLTTGYEVSIGSDPFDNDSDGDGLEDAWEVAHESWDFSPTDPGDLDRDFDGDGLSNRYEMEFGLNLSLADTDGDGAPDGWEVRYRYDALVSQNHGSIDSDGDGLSDLQEFNLGSVPRYFDADGDGLIDEWEDAYGYDRNVAEPKDADGDGLPDWWESYLTGSSYGMMGGDDADSDGLSNQEEYVHGTNPFALDTDEDGLNDYSEIYYPAMGYNRETSYEEQVWTGDTWNSETQQYDSNYATVTHTSSEWVEVFTSPVKADTDGDLLPDGYEVSSGLNPGDATDGRADADQDWLSRGEEYLLGTDHALADTDDDGLSDGEEVLMGTDPLDPLDPGSGDLEGAPAATSNADFRNVLAGRDSDGDGVDDATEMRNGTDPSDASKFIPGGLREECR